MPRYYFNVHDGHSEPDTQGTELADPNAARQTALRYAGEILNDQSHRAALGGSWYMETTDEVGSVVFRLDFHVTDASIDRKPDLSERGAGLDGSSATAVASPISRHVRD